MHKYACIYVYLTYFNINPNARVHALKNSVMTDFFLTLLCSAPSYSNEWCPVNTETGS